MSSLAKHLALVKEHVAIQNRLAKRYENDQKRSAIHVASRDGFIALLDAISQADAELDAAASIRGSSSEPSQAPVLTLRPEELEGLPAELLAELSEGAIPDKADLAIINAIDQRGGIATLDQFMTGLYRTTNELIKRNTLTSKLYRMVQKGTVFPVPTRKGVYSTRRISEEETKRIFGAESQDPQQSLV